MYVHLGDHDRVDVHGHDRVCLLCVSDRCKGVHERTNHLHQVEVGVRLDLDYDHRYHCVYVRRGDHDRVDAHGHGHDRRGGRCHVDARDHHLYLNLNPNDAVNVSMDPTRNAVQ